MKKKAIVVIARKLTAAAVASCLLCYCPQYGLKLDAVFLAFGPLRGNSSSTAAAANCPTAISGIAALISGRCSLDPRLLPHGSLSGLHHVWMQEM